MKTDDDVEREAALWLVRGDRQQAQGGGAFEAWLAEDARHRAAYLKMVGQWSAADRLRVYRPLGAAADPRLLLDMNLSQRAPRRRFQAAAAAAVLFVVLSLGWAWWRTLPTTYRTEVGGYERVVLADGSVVHLNTNTTLRVSLTDDRRHVALIRGEAFFEVTHDVRRPFDVAVGRTTVRAVGTAFTVRDRESDGVEVVVSEGRVTVDDGAAQAAPTVPTLVSAGQTANASRGSTTLRSLHSEELARRLAWQEGELIFDGTRLPDVVADFNRYNTRRLVIDDARLQELEVGGNFHATDLDAFVRSLESSFDIDAHESRAVIHLTSRR